MLRMGCRFQGGWVGKSFSSSDDNGARVQDFRRKKETFRLGPDSESALDPLVHAGYIAIQVIKEHTEYLITLTRRCPARPRLPQSRGTAARWLTGARADPTDSAGAPSLGRAPAGLCYPCPAAPAPAAPRDWKHVWKAGPAASTMPAAARRHSLRVGT